MKTISMLPDKYESFRSPLLKKDLGSKWKKLYMSKAWQTIRLAKLKQSPICEQCFKSPIPRIKTAMIADHITAHKGDREKFFCSLDKLQSLCKACHTRKSQRERGKYASENRT